LWVGRTLPVFDCQMQMIIVSGNVLSHRPTPWRRGQPWRLTKLTNNNKNHYC
jgi:hypothetical protein